MTKTGLEQQCQWSFNHVGKIMRRMPENVARIKMCPLMKKHCMGSECMGWQFIMEQKTVSRFDSTESGEKHYGNVLVDDKLSTTIGVCTAMPSPIRMDNEQ